MTTPDRGAPAVPNANYTLDGATRRPDERLESRLLHAQKMEVVGRLAGGIAHDFNNLLTVIQSHCAFVSMELPAGSAARDDMDQVVKAANCAAELTRQLLAYSRKDTPQLQRLDVNATTMRVVTMLRRIIGEDIRIETDLATADCTVLGYAGQLEQALINLAVNSRDAMPRGGVLSFRTATVEIDAAFARTRPVLGPGRYASIVVEDTGVGIPPDAVARIFEAFYTTKKEGTGLGLSMVLGMVEQSGGDVRVESVPDRGTRFTLLLPCLEEDPAGTRTTAHGRDGSAPAPPRGTESILLVEDEPRVRRAIRRMLERLGYTVRDAATADEAFAMVHALPRLPDLVLTDVVMPGQIGRAHV